MPEPRVRIGLFLKERWEHYALPILRKAPRDRPDLLVYVCFIALIVIGIYSAILVSHV